MWTNNALKDVKTKNITTDSDHHLIFTSLKNNGNVFGQELSLRRDYKDFDKEGYLMELLLQKWTEMYNLKDPNLILDKITELWLETLDKYAPIRVVTSGYGKNRLNLSKEC